MLKDCLNREAICGQSPCLVFDNNLVVCRKSGESPLSSIWEMLICFNKHL